MRGKSAYFLAFILCAATSGLAFAEEHTPVRPAQPQLLSDAELDGITAGATDFRLRQVLNPGNAEHFKISDDGSRIKCVNCFGQTNNPETSGVLFTIKGDRFKVRCIGGGTGCI